MAVLVALLLALLVGEQDLQGPNKLCNYSAAGAPYAITLPDWKVCPVSIEV